MTSLCSVACMETRRIVPFQTLRLLIHKLHTCHYHFRKKRDHFLIQYFESFRLSSGCTSVFPVLGDTSSVRVVGILCHHSSAARETRRLTSACRCRHSVPAHHRPVCQQSTAHQPSVLHRVRSGLCHIIANLSSSPPYEINTILFVLQCQEALQGSPAG